MKIIIDFDKFEDKVFLGYENGKKFRKDLNLQYLDNNNEVVEIIVSDKIYAISSSFVRGFLGDSIVKAGNKEQFYRKYNFKTRALILGVIDNMILRHQLGLL